MKTEYLDATQPGAIEKAAALLRAGQLVVFPTDTLYGVGANAFDPAAVAALYRVKERPLEKGIPVLLSDIAYLEKVTREVPAIALSLIERFWPGPLTLILARHERLPENISPNENVAVRIPDNVVARALIRAAGGAAATSSANRSGRPPASSADEALASFEGLIAAIIDAGPSSYGIPSTIVDCTSEPPRILRAGPLAAEDLALEA